jgi:hypothetical protein
MEFKRLDSFLDTFRSIIARSGLEKRAIIESIQSICGFTLEESAIKISGTILYISVIGAKKTVLSLKKEALLKQINQSRKSQLTDIR